MIPGDDSTPQFAATPEWLIWLGSVGWRILATAVVAIVVLWLMIILSTTTMSILVAAIVSATFAPLVMKLRGRGWSRSAAAGLVTLVALLVISGVVLLFAIAFVPYVGATITSIQAGVTSLTTMLQDAHVPPNVAQTLMTISDDVKAWVTASVTSAAAVIGQIVTIAILGGLLTFYFLQDGDKAFVRAVPKEPGWRHQPIRDAAVEGMQRVGGYLRGSTVLGAIYAVSDLIFLEILGVPNALVLSLFVFILSYIPYIGGIFATIVLLLAALGSGGSDVAVILLVLMSIRNVIVSNLVRPSVYGKTVNLNPAVILLVLPAGAAVAGVFGLFVAIPVTAFLMSISGAVASVLDTQEPSARAHSSVASTPEIPVWLDRTGQWSVRLLVAAALGALVLYIGGLVPLVAATATIGIILAATFLPATRILEKRGMTSGRAALVVTLGLSTTIIVLIILALASLIANAADVTQASDNAVASMTDQEWLQALAGLVGSGILQSLAAVVTALAGLVVVFLLGALLTFYLLRDGSRGWAVVLRRFGGWRRDTVDQAGQRAVTILGNYMIGTGALSAFGAGSTAVIMFILGLPLIMPVAALAFILGFIPYIGSALGTILAFMVAVQYGTSQDIVIMLVWVLVFNIVQGSFMAPIVYGKAVSLHPAIVLIAIPAGGQLAGVMGMFLGVPLLGILAGVWRSVIAVMGDESTADLLMAGSDPPDDGGQDDVTPESG